MIHRFGPGRRWTTHRRLGDQQVSGGQSTVSGLTEGGFPTARATSDYAERFTSASRPEPTAPAAGTMSVIAVFRDTVPSFIAR